MVVSIDESKRPLATINLGDQFGQDTVDEYLAYWEELLTGRSCLRGVHCLG
ncbi:MULTISPECIES: hypothetical protein [unclassified Paenibacillus]|uniref:hypothetical protein n=1 Tax=unclassified Paenibacillus TaxID=185978 RepID=UPI002405C976|nr:MULTISPECIES: hypothetical protein [unclassified Paenibacillus]MDF9843284.1 hypothetical protein [Paenibacillus sp. PastF-2]MDF9849872.1 hypothetical protein [Paenibacillus sp. PastM-2]MDF9856580.1 hypothetical protein [Paenibacillus sp. PastF-1]MDH6481849.1 hypothetical protein [Paenibacillus sp. PastH-2]MDH6509063.1 hypothetical protein [Paenibacillus sp. PastM-3]